MRLKTYMILVAALAFLLAVSAPAGACYSPGACAQGFYPSGTVTMPTSIGTGTYLGCPGCPGCPDNPAREPGEPGCYSLGCPGCPGCPDGNGTPVNPGDPGCLACGCH